MHQYKSREIYLNDGLYKNMKTWNQFLENKQNEMGMPPVISTRKKAQLAPMGEQPPQYQVGLRPNYKAARQSEQPPQYQVGLRPNYKAARQSGQPAPVSDEETGQ